MKKLILFTTIATLLSSCTIEQDSLGQQRIDKSDWPSLEIQGQEIQVNPVPGYIGNKLEGLKVDDYIAQLVVVLEDGEVLIADEKYLGENIEYVTGPEGEAVPAQDYSDVFKDNLIGTKKMRNYQGKRILSRVAYVTTAPEAQASATGEGNNYCGTTEKLMMVYMCNGGWNHGNNFFPTNCSNTSYSWNGYRLCGCFGGGNIGVWPCPGCMGVWILCESFSY